MDKGLSSERKCPQVCILGCYRYNGFKKRSPVYSIMGKVMECLDRWKKYWAIWLIVAGKKMSVYKYMCRSYQDTLTQKLAKHYTIISLYKIINKILNREIGCYPLYLHKIILDRYITYNTHNPLYIYKYIIHIIVVSFIYILFTSIISIYPLYIHPLYLYIVLLFVVYYYKVANLFACLMGLKIKGLFSSMRILLMPMSLDLRSFLCVWQREEERADFRDFLEFGNQSIIVGEETNGFAG